jgi:hypothetical protein
MGKAGKTIIPSFQVCFEHNGNCFLSSQAQIVVLAAQILWSEDVEAALHQISAAGDQKMTPLERVLSQVETTLNILADSVLQEQPPLRRKKLEHLVRTVAL